MACHWLGESDLFSIRMCKFVSSVHFHEDEVATIVFMNR